MKRKNLKPSQDQ